MDQHIKKVYVPMTETAFCCVCESQITVTALFRQLRK